MNSRTTVVVDYGVGNVLSVCRAVEHCGGPVRLTSEANLIATADQVILPGVGAFGDCANTLASHGLIEPLKSFMATGRPFLGICVGMQLLFDYSEEFGHHPGLGEIRGHVRRLQPVLEDGLEAKVPFIGWAELTPGKAFAVRDSWLRAIDNETAVYFVNSYTAQPSDPDQIAAQVWYGSEPICAAIVKDNIAGVQFHPEKSGKTGLRLLNAFLTQ